MAAFIKAAIDLVKNLSQLSTKVIEAGDPEKYADNVEKLHQGVGESYDLMRRIIEDDKTLSTEEKLERLNRIAIDEQAAKDRCGEALNGHREKTAKIALDVLQGFLTCGLSFTPAIVKKIKSAWNEKDTTPSLEAESKEDFPVYIDADAIEIEVSEDDSEDISDDVSEDLFDGLSEDRSGI